MKSYHVAITLNENTSEKEFIEQFEVFAKDQLEQTETESYRVLKLTDKANWPEQPDYLIIFDYKDSKRRLQANNRMEKIYTQKPHSSLMKMVSEFKISFSETISQN